MTDTRPTCPFCEIGHLSTLIFLIVCAYCKKAWKPFEFEYALWRLEGAKPQAGEQEQP